MNYYKYISEGDTDKIIKDMAEYLSNKYSILNKYAYIPNDLPFFEIHIDYIQIFIFSDDSIGVYCISPFNNYSRDKFINDISTFLKYHKRKEALNELS